MTWTTRLALLAANDSCTGPTTPAGTYGAPQLCDTTTYPLAPDGLAETGQNLLAMGWWAFGAAIVVTACALVIMAGAIRAEAKAMAGWSQCEDDRIAIANELENMRARYPLEVKPGSKR